MFSITVRNAQASPSNSTALLPEIGQAGTTLLYVTPRDLWGNIAPLANNDLSIGLTGSTFFHSFIPVEPVRTTMPELTHHNAYLLCISGAERRLLCLFFDPHRGRALCSFHTAAQFVLAGENAITIAVLDMVEHEQYNTGKEYHY